MGARVQVQHYNLGSADSYIGSSLHDLNSVDGPTRDIDGIGGAVGRDGDSLDNNGHSSSADEKISQAYCPPRTVEGYPCLVYVKYLILPRFNELTVENEKNGGNKTFKSFEDIAADYESGELNPEDLKKALMKASNIMLQPVHDHFKTNERAKNLLEQVKMDSKQCLIS